jgi:site-specific recombinase XerD
MNRQSNVSRKSDQSSSPSGRTDESIGTNSFAHYGLRIQRLATAAEVRRQLGDVRFPELPAGMHFLVSAEGHHTPFAPFLEFVADRGLTRSPHKARLKKSARTVEAYASDLHDFFGFLDAAHTRWEDVGVATAELYVDTMIERPSPVTGEPYSDSTIIRRVSTLRTFYGWARDRGICRYGLLDLEAWQEIKARRIEAVESLEYPVPLPPDREVRPIPVEDLEAIFAKLGPLPPLSSLPEAVLQGIHDAVRVRNRLMAECALQIGLRRTEVVSLKTTDVLGIALNYSAPFHLHPIRILGKGAKWRTVLVPTWLIEALQHYISVQRVPTADGARTHDRIFVEHTATEARGNSLSAKCLNDVFRTACVAAGFAQPHKPHRARYVVHHLRHSFALATYFSRKQAGDPEPWLEIQALLGHSRLETTLRIYLRVAKALQSKYSDYFHKVFNDMVADYA